MRRFLPLFALFLILVVAVPSGNATGFQVRRPGVSPGQWLSYDLYSGLGHSIVLTTVNNVSGTVIGYSTTYTSDNGTVYRRDSFYQDVAGYYPVQFPPMFIAAGLVGGAVLPGNSNVLTSSIFGHILAGQWRLTNYWDEAAFDRSQHSMPQPGAVFHYEYDRATGALVSLQDTYNDAGSILTLKATNLWSPSLFWFVVATGIAIGEIIAPITGIALAFWFGSFLFVGLYDKLHVRSLRGRSGGKAGMNFMYKFLIIAALITVAIMMTALIIYQLVILPALAGG